MLLMFTLYTLRVVAHSFSEPSPQQPHFPLIGSISQATNTNFELTTTRSSSHIMPNTRNTHDAPTPTRAELNRYADDQRWITEWRPEMNAWDELYDSDIEEVECEIFEMLRTTIRIAEKRVAAYEARYAAPVELDNSDDEFHDAVEYQEETERKLKDGEMGKAGKDGGRGLGKEEDWGTGKNKGEGLGTEEYRQIGKEDNRETGQEEGKKSRTEKRVRVEATEEGKESNKMKRRRISGGGQ
jgi:hypothetical protein